MKQPAAGEPEHHPTLLLPLKATAAFSLHLKSQDHTPHLLVICGGQVRHHHHVGREGLDDRGGLGHRDDVREVRPHLRLQGTTSVRACWGQCAGCGGKVASTATAHSSGLQPGL